MLANGLVILVAAMLSLQLVVHLWIGAPIAGSIFLFLCGAALYALVVAALGILLGTLSTTMGQFGVVRAGGAVSRRGPDAGLAPARRHAAHRLGVFRPRHEPLPPRHFRELAAMPKTQAKPQPAEND